MGATVDRFDNDIMTVGIFVGQAALDDAADQRSLGRGRVIDKLIDDRRSSPAFRIGALHRTNDVAALTHAAQRVGKIRSEEHTSELQSLMRISYAVFCLK